MDGFKNTTKMKYMGGGMVDAPMKGQGMPDRKPASTGLARAAEMSGRTMPDRKAAGGMMKGQGMPDRKPASTGLARAAEMSGRTMPATGRRLKAGGLAVMPKKGKC